MTSPQLTQDVPPAQEQQAPSTTLFNKYGYEEFAGFKGYDRLDRITQLILSAANARTWRNSDKFVAPGNDLYAGTYAVADIVKPGVRKIEMDFKSLRELELIDMYPDYRLVKQRNTGQVEMTACIVKDFSKLYALAHEYYLWELSPEYIPPEWQYKKLILANADLTAKLRRFDNYRRILECHQPGRKRVQSEPPSHADMLAIEAEDAQDDTSGIDPKGYNNTSNKTFSANRDTRIPLEELNQDRSSRSGRAADLGGKGGVAPVTIRNGEVTGTVNRDGDNQRTVVTSNTNTPTVMENAAPRTAKDAEAPKTRRKKHTAGEMPPEPLPGFLMANYLKPISVYFCDQSPTASATSMAWLFAEFRQRGFDEVSDPFIDLINEARDITNLKMSQGLIRARNTDGSVAQMRYFLSVLETNVYVWCRRYDEVLEDLRQSAQGDASEENLEHAQDGKDSFPEQPYEPEECDVTHDEGRNLEYVQEDQPAPPPINAEELEASPSQQEDQPLATTLLEQETELSSNGTETTFSSPSLASSPDEQQGAMLPQGESEEWWPVPIPDDGTGIQYPNREIVGFIDTTDPDEGWRHGTAAFKAGQLHFYLGREHYQYAILPTHCHGRYGIIIVERQTGREKVFVRDWEIVQTMQQHLRL